MAGEYSGGTKKKWSKKLSDKFSLKQQKVVERSQRWICEKTWFHQNNVAKLGD